MSDHYECVKKYFDDKADLYDDVDKQLYWVLSDNFFKNILAKEIPNFITGKSIRLLDAGAGTGRWTDFICQLFAEQYDIGGDLVDISEKMLEVAQNKFRQKNFYDNFRFHVGNIEKMPEILDNFYDLSISFYNVISFVEHPDLALSEIKKKLKEGGYHISVVVNKYHAIYFSILTNRIASLKQIKLESKIRFNDLMPAIRCFTPNEIKELYQKLGYNEVRVIGGPNFLYPGMEETFVKGQTKILHNKLASQDVFDKILKIELDYYDQTDIGGRSNALMVIAKK